MDLSRSGDTHFHLPDIGHILIHSAAISRTKFAYQALRIRARVVENAFPVQCATGADIGGKVGSTVPNSRSNTERGFTSTASGRSGVLHDSVLV